MSDYNNPSNEYNPNYERRLHNLKMMDLEQSEGQREPSPEEMERIELIEQENQQLKQEIELLRKRLKKAEQSERKNIFGIIPKSPASFIGPAPNPGGCNFMLDDYGDYSRFYKENN